MVYAFSHYSRISVFVFIPSRRINKEITENKFYLITNKNEIVNLFGFIFFPYTPLECVFLYTYFVWIESYSLASAKIGKQKQVFRLWPVIVRIYWKHIKERNIKPIRRFGWNQMKNHFWNMVNEAIRNQTTNEKPKKNLTPGMRNIKQISDLWYLFQ